ncbi:hypothetical protein [Microbulbifer celer]|uniref:Uncharacterized protein n=1 Tax=Microbulbifer celer TaxID=435905 RepID=A0ABW3U999_9GAMM|nr:hypothetical protein [Microbulbifer celer]UFN58561.1 hypothetical protein LPW13_05830 [Microbulbifer celer]
MTQLFGHKWVSQEGEIRNERGEYSRNFLFWARKTAHLSDTQWRRGMDHVEYKVREAARQGGDDEWPPSYAAFLGFCDPRPGSQMYKSFEPLKLPDKGAQERAQEAGARALDEMKSLFNEETA